MTQSDSEFSSAQWPQMLVIFLKSKVVQFCLRSLYIHTKTGSPLKLSKVAKKVEIQYNAELSAAQNCLLLSPLKFMSWDLTSSKRLNYLNVYLIVSLVHGRGFFTVLWRVSWLTSQQSKHFWEANVFPSSFPLRIITVLYYTTDQLFGSDFQRLSEAKCSKYSVHLEMLICTVSIKNIHPHVFPFYCLYLWNHSRK